MAFVEYLVESYDIQFGVLVGGVQLYLAGINAYHNVDAARRCASHKPPPIAAPDLDDTLTARLGELVLTAERTKSHRWTLGAHDAVVRYEKATGCVQLVQVNVPRK